MHKALSFLLTITTFSVILFSSCGSDDIEEPEDYREFYIGTYEGLKSFRSFSDTVTATSVTFDVDIDSSTTDGLIINGIEIPISTNGTFGPEFIGDENGVGNNFTVTFLFGEVRIKDLPIIPFGQSAPCLISATRI